MVITAGAMVAMIGMTAFVIDIGSFDQVQRQAQTAADAAALAGAHDLPGSQTTATTDAIAYVTKNLSGATPVVTFPTSTEIKVVVSKTSPSFFGKIFGVNSANISATSVASESPGVTGCTSAGSTCYAMFAMDTSCSGNPITLGGGSNVTGGVFSNGSIDVGGGGSSLGATNYSNASGCTVRPSSWAQNSNSFISGPTATAPLTSWPINYALDFPACSGGACTGPGGTPSFCTQATTATDLQLVTYYPGTLVSDNIYCGVGSGTPSNPATWNAEIDVAGGPATDTFVAGTVKIGGGSSLDACGYTSSGYSSSSCSGSVPAPVTANYPLAYAVGTGTSIDDSAGGSTFHGDLFAPHGTIDIGGGSWTTFAEGLDVSAPGGGFSVTGDGPSTTGPLSGTASEALIQ
jgi:type II secretory pathway pseudopilin PulG